MTTISTEDQIRLRAEEDLEFFIKLVHPGRVLGKIHQEVIQWWNREDANSHQLLLLPRDHQKSAMIAYRVAWEITKNPALRVLYISSTANLATKQLKFIKDIFTSDIYRRYWPEMVNPDEGKREKWTEREISVDHPRRKEQAVRDPTIFTAGLTTSIVGMHCDIAVMDDVVVSDNANTEDGRAKVEQQYSLLASIEGARAREWIVGTRYDPRDLYASLMSKTVQQYENGIEISSRPLFEKFERQVEDRGDGTGQFLWPKQITHDGMVFGFDENVLATKRAQYLDQRQFRAQYYNNPNDLSTSTISKEYFQYYDPQFLAKWEGKWTYKGARLNVFAAIDFAYSLSKRADYTCITIVGVDTYNNYYVLDIERFRSNKISEYFQKILDLHQKWDFRKIKAEVTAAQEIIVRDLKENYIRKYGLSLSVEDYRPSRSEGNKEERVEATLQPRYANRQIWHYYGGNCQILEEELVLSAPPHDDVKDCLASCIASCVPPTMNKQLKNNNENLFHKRFGGFA